jgi:site-specific DNA-methyltransferase (adenine-specific)
MTANLDGCLILRGIDKMSQIILGDSQEVLKTIPDNGLDICITSPPYKDSDGFDLVEQGAIFKEVYRVLKDDSLFFLNFGHLAEDKLRPFQVVSMAVVYGNFKLNDTIVWKKTQYSPIQGDVRLNNLTEFIFLLYKGNMPKLDRLAVGIPYKDKSNVGRYANQDLRCGGNFWEFGYETIQSKEQKLHNDRFPIELPRRCLKLSGLKSGIVLDPFGGSGTTAVAAKELGLDYLLIEKQEKNIITAQKRLS